MLFKLDRINKLGKTNKTKLQLKVNRKLNLFSNIGKTSLQLKFIGKPDLHLNSIS